MLSIRVTKEQFEFMQAYKERLGKQRYWKPILFAQLIDSFGETCDLFLPKDADEKSNLHKDAILFSTPSRPKYLPNGRRSRVRVPPFEIQALQKVMDRLGARYGVFVTRSMAMRSMLQAMLEAENNTASE